MCTADFQVLLKTLRQLQLAPDDAAALQEFLASLTHPGLCIALIEAAAGRPPCPHCACARSHRCGKANGLQRYRCMGCGSSYNALTGTPLAHLKRRDKWLAYLQCLIESTTVRAAAKRVQVAKSTSFRWRHRFIAAVRQERRPKLSGVVEADEGGVLACKRAPLRRRRVVLAETPAPPYHLESQKGARHLDRPPRKRGGVATRRGISRELDCILVARDRNKLTYDFVTGRGPVSARQLAACLLVSTAEAGIDIDQLKKFRDQGKAQHSRTAPSVLSLPDWGAGARCVGRENNSRIRMRAAMRKAAPIDLYSANTNITDEHT